MGRKEIYFNEKEVHEVIKNQKGRGQEIKIIYEVIKEMEEYFKCTIEKENENDN